LAVKELKLKKLKRSRIHFIFPVLILFLFLSLPILSKTQNTPLNYKIIQGGDEIGWLKLEKYFTGNTLNLSLVSEIKTRFIFTIHVTAKETSAYEKGKLVYSSQFRKSNGSTKLDKQTRCVMDKYVVQENGKMENLNFSFIGTNLLSMYFYEPSGVNLVYCDKHECFLKIIKTADDGYKVSFPDGTSNLYYYKAGICYKIMIRHTFYSAEIILNP
jgi:hypothetical protein